MRLNLLWLLLVAMPLAACKTTATPAANEGDALPAAMTSSFPDGFLWARVQMTPATGTSGPPTPT